MFNLFKKKTTQQDDKNGKQDDTQKMGMMQRIAMKKLANMGPAERNKLMQDMMKPENKGKIMAAMDMMKKSGQISEDQIEEAKKKLGL